MRTNERTHTHTRPCVHAASVANSVVLFECVCASVCVCVQMCVLIKTKKGTGMPVLAVHVCDKWFFGCVRLNTRISLTAIAAAAAAATAAAIPAIAISTLQCIFHIQMRTQAANCFLSMTWTALTSNKLRGVLINWIASKKSNKVSFING